MNYPQELLDVNRRHDFVVLFDVSDGNPNGDPDAGNLPRVDPETMHGIVTDVCIKRKIRDWIALTQRADDGSPLPNYEIYVKHLGVLNREHQRAYDAEPPLKSTGTKQDLNTIEEARKRMCRMFYDIRTFGAVMSTGVNCGQVRGPIQLTFARSIDPITPLDISITRVAVTREEDIVSAIAPDEESTQSHTKGKQTEMGRKAIVPYGLYRFHAFFNPPLAQQTGFSSDDLRLFLDALQNMWDIDRSSSRGLMALRGLYSFTHASHLGNAPAHALFDLIQIKLKPDIPAPRSFNDYTVTILEDNVPQNITLHKILQ